MAWFDAIIPAAAALGSAALGYGAANKAANAGSDAASQAAAAQLAMYDQTREDYTPYRETGYNALRQLAAMYGLPDLAGASTPTFDTAAYLAAHPDVAKSLATGVENGQATPYSSALEHYQKFGSKAGWEAPLTGAGAAGSGTFTPNADAWKQSPGYQFRLEEGQKALDRSAAARGMLLSGAQTKATQQYGQNLATDEFDRYANRLASLAGIGQTATGSTAAAGSNAAAGQANAALAGGQARASGYLGGAQAVNQGVGNLLYLYGR